MSTTLDKPKEFTPTVASRFDGLTKSSVRELLKRAQKENLINLSPGQPDPNLFPMDQVQTATDQVLTNHGANAFSYSNSEGDPKLREYIAHQYLEKRGIPASADQILITNGSQQGIDLLGKVLLEQNTPITMERPTYMAALQTLSLYTSNFSDTTMYQDGTCPQELKHILEKSDSHLFYSVSSFHNPTGRCYTPQNRRTVASVLEQTGTLLIEDTPYDFLVYDGQTTTPISSYIPNQSVILGSFSKIIFPGLRLGWLWCKNKELYTKLVTAKQATDLCTSQFIQHLVSTLVTNIDMDNHITHLCQCYKSKRDTMKRILEQHLPTEVQWTLPQGGMFFWLKLPAHLSSQQLLEQTLHRGVVFTPGTSFFIGRNKPENYLRLNFTYSPTDELQQGTAIICETINNAL